MTKTKRQLRADAPELRDTWSKYYDPETRTYSVPCDELFADTDTPATDADAPISDNVRECPQCDPVELMRKAAGGYSGEMGKVTMNAKQLLGMNVDDSSDASMFRKLADMVERDYVNRAIFDAVCVLRDKLTSMVDDATADFAAAVKQRDEARADAERWRVQFNECDEENINLRKERDYWKARAERYPYDQRIVGNGRDWGEIMRDAFDSLMSTAGECCTEAELMALDSYVMQEMRRGTANDASAPANGVTADGAHSNEGNAHSKAEPSLSEGSSDGTNGIADGTNGIPCAAPLDDGVKRSNDGVIAEYDALSDVGEHSPGSESGCESDTREKLEADTRDLLVEARDDAWAGIDCDYAESYLGRAIALLDRQAAITERECIDRWDAKALLRVSDLEGERDRLLAKVDELTAERDECADAADAAEAKARRADEADSRWGAALRDLEQAQAERDHWEKVAGEHASEMQGLRSSLNEADARMLMLQKSLKRMEGMVPHPEAHDGTEIRKGLIMRGTLDGREWEVDGIDWSKAQHIVKAHDPYRPEIARDLKPEWLERDSLKAVRTDINSQVFDRTDDESVVLSARWLHGVVKRIEKLEGENQ